MFLQKNGSFSRDYTQNGNKHNVCIKPEHENNKICFICLYEDCSSESRIGCAHCFLESHQSHLSQKLKITSFQDKLTEKIEKIKGFYSSFDLQEQDSLLFAKIEADFFELKQDFSRNLGIIQENLIEFYKQKMKKVKKEREKLDEFLVILKENLQKNVFEMKNNELESSIQIFQDKGFEKKPQNFLKEFLDQYDNIKHTICKYLKDFRVDFEIFFKKLVENHTLSDLNQKHYEKNRANSSKIDNFSNTFSNKFKEITNMKSIVKTTNEKIQKKIIKGELLGKNAKNFYEIYHNKYCEHMKKIKKADIYPCCNKAFLCKKCHDKESSHQWDVKKDILLGYCLTCYTIIKHKEEKCPNCLILLN